MNSGQYPIHDIDKSLPGLFLRAGIMAERRQKIEAGIRHLTRRSELDRVNWRRDLEIGLLDKGLSFLGLRRQGEENTRDIRLRELTVSPSNLPPALSGFRILHLSDLHFGVSFPAHAEAVYRIVEGIEADCCVITGDFRYGHFGPSYHVASMTAKMLAGARFRHGVYAVLGNHDSLVIGERLESIGVRVLYNEGILLEADGTAFWLAGVDDPHFFRCHDLAAAFRGAPAEIFSILLAHSPELYREAAERGVGLYLCGHTHGGQVCLPGIGAVNKNARCRRDQISGIWREKAMIGYTSTGMGATDLPVRFNCPPEAVLMTLATA